MAIQVELHITGLAILDTESMMIQFIDTPDAGACHQHHPLITFRPDDYVGARIPKMGFDDLFRPGSGGDFLTSFPLRGAVTIGTEDELEDENASPPTIGTDPPDGLHLLDEIVSLGQLGYSGLAGEFGEGLAAKISASIRLVDGELYAAKRMIDENGDLQSFEKGEEEGLCFCEHIVWTRLLDETLFVRKRDREFLLGLKAPLRFSLTNLPTHGWLGSTADREYFRHLDMLGALGVAVGTFAPPSIPEGGLSSGSESCSPAKRP